MIYRVNFRWISLVFAISSIILCWNLSAPVQAQNSFSTNNELSLTVERVRGGWEPLDFFDGHAIGISYNRQLIPYVLLHSEVSFARLLLTDNGGGDYASELHYNSMIVSDLGISLVPVSNKWFELRFSFAGSFQNRHTSNGMDPETKSGNQTGERVYFFNFSTMHTGYKFELKTPIVFSRQFFLAPVATVRSYPKGKYDIPRSFELGIQGGFQF